MIKLAKALELSPKCKNYEAFETRNKNNLFVWNEGPSTSYLGPPEVWYSCIIVLQVLKELENLVQVFLCLRMWPQLYPCEVIVVY